MEVRRDTRPRAAPGRLAGSPPARRRVCLHRTAVVDHCLIPRGSYPTARSSRLCWTRGGEAEYDIPQVAFPRGPAMRYRCPACRRPSEAPDEEAGQQVQCPHCGERFTLPRTLPPAPAPPRATSPGPAGSGALAAIPLTCPTCGQPFEAERVVGPCDVVCP